MSDKADSSATTLAQQLLAALPQTQCTRCGYPDCAAYAQAIAHANAPINQCPPGGQEGVVRLAALTQQAVVPLNPDFGSESPRNVAVIDEDWCIGCTLCLKACPVDAIVGSNKRMHTVLEAHCTGCDLCLPVCPVDCISMVNASGEATGWQAWSTDAASNAKERYHASQLRRARATVEHTEQKEAQAQAKLSDLKAHSQISDPSLLEQKRALIEAALARARAQRQVGG